MIANPAWLGMDDTVSVLSVFFGRRTLARTADDSQHEMAPPETAFRFCGNWPRMGSVHVIALAV